ncbi:hypothetical protein BDV30DRAFT_208993 [Aspergillus minisclerotigenes]|uniref:Uncharacterized protein n=1 Tax=Aspergillus minisclerotigenes TaxID=656917 RepID=A0A5N6J9I6_9EURO|nr:hypothetical protein BDV30DRAFT_208993 [Aspergillus minisclerotigenes]
MQKAILASLLGFAWLQSTLASPIVSTDSPNIIVTHRASDLFPEFAGDLGPFDVDVEYVGYEAETRAWLVALDPSSGNTDEEKAVFLTRQPMPRSSTQMIQTWSKMFTICSRLGRQLHRNRETSWL